jgi:hypothetical protein
MHQEPDGVELYDQLDLDQHKKPDMLEQLDNKETQVSKYYISSFHSLFKFLRRRAIMMKKQKCS